MARWRTINLAVSWSVTVLSLATWAQDAAAPRPVPQRFRQAAIIRFEGPITGMLEQYFYRKLEAAQSAGCDLVIVSIDSPGGELEASLNVAHRLRDTQWARTVAWIPRQALSGAAIVALGCDEIIMRPAAVIGDAGPIFLDEGFMFQHAPEKIRSDLARKVRDLASAKGRPPALAEAMVDDQLVVFRMRNLQTDDIAFMSDAELVAADNQQQWEKVKPVLESRDEKFLEVSGQRAVELQLATATADDETALWQRYPVEKEVIRLDQTAVDQAVFVLNHWLVTGLLVAVGLIALFVELSAPGISIGGLVAGLCFALFFWSRFLGGTAAWLEVVLFLCGLVFLLIELFVLPGFGIAGVAGILLMGVSLVLASQSFLIPGTASEFSKMTVSLATLVAAVMAVIVLGSVIVARTGQIPVLNRLVLNSPPVEVVGVGGASQAIAVSAAERWGLELGQEGVARSALRPAGRCRFGDRDVDVVADGAFIKHGTRVRVIDISGHRVMVSAIEE